MNEAPTRGACSRCNGTDLCYGTIGNGIGNSSNVFVPSGVFIVHGFRTRSYVCLKCGHVGQFLPADKLERLREKFHANDEEQS